MFPESTIHPKPSRDLRHAHLSGVDYSLYDERNMGKEDISTKVFRLLIPLAIYGMGLYILLNILLMIFMPYIIELCVGQWKMDIVGLDLGPPPAWLDDPPLDFRNLPPGSDKYTNVSLSLSVKNNSWWLSVEVTEISMGVRERPSAIILYSTVPIFAGDATFTLTSKVPFAAIDATSYICLQHVPNDRAVLVTLSVRTRFKILSLSMDNFMLRTSSMPTFRRTASEHRLSPDVSRILRFCLDDGVWSHRERSSMTYQCLSKICVSKVGPPDESFLIGPLRTPNYPS